MKRLIEHHPTNITTIARTFDIKPDLLYHWYKNYISDYKKDLEDGRYKGEKILKESVKTMDCKEDIIVTIFKPKNMGEIMLIDEKMVGKKYVIILSNQNTGKIALLLESMKPELIKLSLLKFDKNLRESVNYTVSDLSPMMIKICQEVFPNSKHVADKFHVIKHCIDAFNDVKNNIKNNIDTDKDIKTIYGWTLKELLQKARYIFYKKYTELEAEEKIIIDTCFIHFPTIKIAYLGVEKFRIWFQKTDDKKSKFEKADALKKIVKELYETGLKPLKNIAKLIEHHWHHLLNYFECGASNAKAENLNGRIQRFLSDSYGTRDRCFFFYRVQLYFS